MRPGVVGHLNLSGVDQGTQRRALTDHELLAPLTKKVSRVPVSRQNCANAATTGTLAPSSTVSANWLPSPGNRASTPDGGGIRPRGISHRTGRTASRRSPSDGGQHAGRDGAQQRAPIDGGHKQFSRANRSSGRCVSFSAFNSYRARGRHPWRRATPSNRSTAGPRGLQQQPMARSSCRSRSRTPGRRHLAPPTA